MTRSSHGRHWLNFVGVGACSLVATATVAGTASAAAPAPALLPASLNAVYVVMDTSGSMGDSDPTGTVKIEGAKSAVLSYLENADAGTAIALRTYPDPQAESCNAGKLRYNLERHEPREVAAVVRGLQPDGDTPTAEALRQAAVDIRGSGYSGATIVLVSDGESTCDDPCVAAQEIVQSGLQLQVISVGFQMSQGGQEELECIAQTTGGRYVDASDSDQLETIFQDLAAPRLAVALTYPDRVIADVGFGRKGLVSISATVSNRGQVTAQGVQVRIQFRSANPGVIAPVRALGNLDPGVSSSEVTWSFRPSLALAGTVVDFAVVVRAINMSADVGSAGSIDVIDATTAQDARPGVFGARIAILGDSYSAGEGADKYTTDTDNETNRCHRSPLTHTVKTFGLDISMVLACSGAVTNDLFNTNDAGVPSQLRQLDDLQSDSGPLDSVVLTIGGNDAGFREVVEACLLNRASCSSEVAGQSSQEYLSSHMAPLRTRLMQTYLAVHQVLNTEEMVAERGGMAPIYVLGYPRPVPTANRTCTAMGNFKVNGENFNLFSTDEVKFGTKFLTRLNGEVEGAVLASRLSRDKVPVFFVSLTEDAFMPNHTMCDKEPYARGISSFNGAALKLDVTVEEIVLALAVPSRFRLAALFSDDVVDALKRGKNELFHPNEDGYRAMTTALIRWSNSTEGAEVQGFLSTVPQPPPLGTCPADSDTTPIDLSQGTLGVLRSCLPYELRVTDFAPGATVTVTVNSEPVVLGVVTSGADGAVDLRVVLPQSLPPGEHHFVVGGNGPDGEYRTVAASFTVDGPGGPMLPWILVLGGLSLLLIGGGLVWFGRRATRRTVTASQAQVG